MSRPAPKTVVRPAIDRELARKLQALLEKANGRAVSISETCEHALRVLYIKLKSDAN